VVYTGYNSGRGGLELNQTTEKYASVFQNYPMQKDLKKLQKFKERQNAMLTYTRLTELR
jgi:hypothetical protein